MRALSSEVTAAINSRVVRLVQLIEMHLPDGVLYMNTSPWTLPWSGASWLPIFGVGAIDTINDQGAELAALTFTLSGVYVANLALVLTTQVQGCTVHVRTAILNDARQILDAPIEWSGRLDTMSINEQGSNSTISVSAEHFGIDLTRPSNLRMSQQDQTRQYPGDNFFDKLITTADQEITWPAASFKS